MCLALPYHVVEVVDDGTAVVTRGGVTTTVSLLPVEGGVTAGDWVLVHSGLVISRLTDDDALEIEDLASNGGLT